MRILVQVVQKARVIVNEEVVGQIGRGFLLFVGFTLGDEEQLVEKMAQKVLALRLFPDAKGATNKALDDVQGEILSVSQFTLYGDVSNGRRPSFTKALNGQDALKLFEEFNRTLEKVHGKIATGVFGKAMQVELINDGPFTLLLDSKEIYG
ncbi:MAG: D-aminoacyl-tRNA deacylase [Bacilli bacterium]